jgi:8-oxo-dGTP diphosphatase
MGKSPPQHIVAAGALVADAQGRVLLIDSPWRGWEFPGGQIERGEDIVTGLQREVFEETGVSISVGPLTGLYSNLSRGVVIATFLADYVSGQLRTSAESLQVKWCDRQRCSRDVSHPAVLARLQDMLDYDGSVIVRAYTIEPYRLVSEHKA